MISGHKKKNEDDDFGRKVAELVSDYAWNEGLSTFVVEKKTRVGQFWFRSKASHTYNNFDDIRSCFFHR